MTRLIKVLLSFSLLWILLTCSASECYTVQVGAPGWKYVNGVPGYGIKGDVVQFFSTIPLVLWEDPGTHVKLSGSSEAKLGTITLEFSIDPAGRDYRRLKATFKEPLAGMNVEAFAYDAGTGAEVRLLDEDRVFTDTVSVVWPDLKVTSVRIALHAHLSKKPILKDFAVGVTGPIASVEGLDPAFKKEGVLFFYSPDGSAREMCANHRISETIPISMVNGRTVQEVKASRRRN